MTRPAPETDADAGACARALAQRAVSVVDARTRRSDPVTSLSGVAITLAHYRSRDPDTTPTTAIDHARSLDELLALPCPGGTEPCLTVRDARRVAACHERYRRAGDPERAATCARLLDAGLPRVLERAYVRGP